MGIPQQSSGWDVVLSLPAPGSIPGWKTKIPQAVQHGQKKKAFMNHKEKNQLEK